MKKHFLRVPFLATLCTLMCLSFFTAKASHFAGGEFTYECLSNNQYRITMIFYRDCSGIDAPTSVAINIASTCGSNSANLAIKPDGGGFVNGEIIANTCGSVLSVCEGGTAPGLRKWTYEGIITLPTNSCNMFTISYADCCRNGAITSLSNPTSTGYYVECKINRSVCNDAPKFSNNPLAFACINQSFNYNQAAIDPEGDSLVYSLVSPMSDAVTPVVFNAGYSATNPILNTGGFNLNVATGAITVNPNTIEVGVFTIKVKEFRNNVLIGETNRDIQIFVTSCGNNSLPSLSGFNGGTTYTMDICAGEQTCLTINSADANNAQNLTLSWNAGIAGATFNAGTGSRPTGTLCWTPTAADIGNNPHIFTVTVKDNACPTNGVSVYTYSLNVRKVKLTGTPTDDSNNNCVGGVNITVTGNSGALTYQWSNGSTTQDLTNVCAGTYTVTVTDAAGCDATASYIVGGTTNQCDLKLTIRSGPEGACKTGGIITVNMTDGTAPYSATLTNTVGNVNVTKNSSVDFVGFNNLGTGEYDVVVTDGDGCTATGSATVLWEGCGAPTNVDVKNITNTSAKVTWTICNGTKFKVCYKNQTTGALNFVTVNNTNKVNLTGLSPNTLYSVKVKTLCSATESSMFTLPRGFCTGSCTNRDLEDFDVTGAVNASSFAMVSPTVSNDIFNVYAETDELQPTQIVVNNTIGQIVYTENIGNGITEFSRALDLSALQTGVYLLTVRNGFNSQTIKIVLQ